MGELKQPLQFQGFNFQPCHPLSEMEINMELTKQQLQHQENFNISDLSLETLLAHQQPQPPASYSNNKPLIANLCGMPTFHSIAMDEDFLTDPKKRKVVKQSTGNSHNFSPPVSANDYGGSSTNIKPKNRLGRERRGRSYKKDAEKTEEVIHVRAKRGQATDSHSLAERVRREKINEKMRCLQDLVPGCHKAMGMAAMLDEIINYVQSLQNQVEFLSMELAAACSSSEGTESPKKLLGTNSHVCGEMEKWARIRNGEPYSLQSTWPLSLLWP